LEKDFVISVQIDPGKEIEPSKFANIALNLRARNIQVVDINSSSSGVKHDSLVLASQFSQFGFQVIPHITPRDSLLNAVLGQFLGAYTFYDVKHVLVIRGDERTDSSQKGVYETYSIGLIEALSKLRKERKMDFAIGCAFDQTTAFFGPYCVDLDAEIARLIEKREAGADFIMTQPIWRYSDWLMVEEIINYVKLPALVGIWPIFDRNTLNIVRGLGKRKLPGIIITNDIFEKLDKASDLIEISLELTANLIKDLKEKSRVDGIYLVAPFRQNNFADFYKLLDLIK